MENNYYIQEIVNSSLSGAGNVGWYKDLHDYYYRPEWELFDLKLDPKEMKNVANDPNYKVKHVVVVYLQAIMKKNENKQFHIFITIIIFKLTKFQVKAFFRL